MNKKQKAALEAAIGPGPYVRIEVDCRDSSKDCVMARKMAHERFKLGQLCFNETNGNYCVPENGKLPSWMDAQTAPRYDTSGLAL